MGILGTCLYFEREMVGPSSSKPDLLRKGGFPDPMTRCYPLEPPINEMRRLVDDAMQRLETHIESLDRQPADQSADDARLAPGLRETLPEIGQAYSLSLIHI